MEVVASQDPLGAEICGLDLGSGLSPEQLTAVEQAFVEHKVLFFRDQSMTAAGHQRFASWFGKLERHPAFPHVDGYPEVTVLESGRENRSKIERWHSDMTYLACPPLGSILRARVVPESGGDTLWLDAEAAWQALPVALRERLAPMQAEHSFAHGYRESLAEPGGRRRLAAAVAANPPLSHPVMRTHPASGRPSLFVNSLFTTRLLGLEEAESQDLLGRLFEHLENPDFQCRFVWEVDSVAFWDNRCTQHRPDKDWWPATRRHERTTIEGDRPR